MKKIAMSLLLLTSCTCQDKGFSKLDCVVEIDTNKIVCNADAAGAGYEDALEAVEKAPKY